MHITKDAMDDLKKNRGIPVQLIKIEKHYYYLSKRNPLYLDKMLTYLLTSPNTSAPFIVTIKNDLGGGFFDTERGPIYKDNMQKIEASTDPEVTPEYRISKSGIKYILGLKTSFNSGELAAAYECNNCELTSNTECCYNIDMLRPKTSEAGYVYMQTIVTTTPNFGDIYQIVGAQKIFDVSNKEIQNAEIIKIDPSYNLSFNGQNVFGDISFMDFHGPDKSNKPLSYGVIVGRFQTPYLTEGHKFLISEVYKRHQNLIVFIGVHKTQPTRRNPLDFETRKQMILESYSNAIVLPIHDNVRDDLWCAYLDELIKQKVQEHIATNFRNKTISDRDINVCLYGSRDSFLKFYNGNYPTEEVQTEINASASEIRAHVANTIECSEAFRKGQIYAIWNRFSSPYLAVDVAMIDRAHVLLGRKAGETAWRFIGGFVDNTDESMEAAAHRELIEEASCKEPGAGLVVDEFELIGQARIEDWRYSGDDENIFSAFFACKYISGAIEANDDIEQVKWHPIPDLLSINFSKSHEVLRDILLGWWKI